MTDRFVREPECLKMTGLSRITRWRLERKGAFPKRRQISPNCIAWLQSELHEWLDTRKRGPGPGPAAKFAGDGIEDTPHEAAA